MSNRAIVLHPQCIQHADEGRKVVSDRLASFQAIIKANKRVNNFLMSPSSGTGFLIGYPIVAKSKTNWLPR